VFLQNRCFLRKTLFIFQKASFFGDMLMSLVNDLDQEVENFKREYEKFERGNKSAGTRARKVLQDIKKTCQEIRVSIQGAKKEEEKSNIPPAN
jgi:hypothetical protein